MPQLGHGRETEHVAGKGHHATLGGYNLAGSARMHNRAPVSQMIPPHASPVFMHPQRAAVTVNDVHAQQSVMYSQGPVLMPGYGPAGNYPVARQHLHQAPHAGGYQSLDGAYN